MVLARLRSRSARRSSVEQMGTPVMEAKKAEARKKAAAAAAVAGVTTAVAVAGAPIVVVGAGVAGSAILGYRWLKYRIKEGIRF